MKSSLLLSVIAYVFCSSAVNAAVVTQWNFESQNLSPNIGAGSASGIGGVSSSFAQGTGGTGTFAFSTSAYASQGTASGQRGVQFLVSTAGFTNVSLAFDQRATATASRWAQVDYTVDGGSNWTIGFWNNNGGLSPNDLFYNFNVDFSTVVAANENPNFGFRIVSIFSPVAFDQNASLGDFAANTAYMRASDEASFTAGGGTGTGNYATNGTWRFDNVTISATAIPEPVTGVVFSVWGIAGLTAYRRRKQKVYAADCISNAI